MTFYSNCNKWTEHTSNFISINKWTEHLLCKQFKNWKRTHALGLNISAQTSHPLTQKNSRHVLQKFNMILSHNWHCHFIDLSCQQCERFIHTLGETIKQTNGTRAHRHTDQSLILLYNIHHHKIIQLSECKQLYKLIQNHLSKPYHITHYLKLTFPPVKDKNKIRNQILSVSTWSSEMP